MFIAIGTLNGVSRSSGAQYAVTDIALRWSAFTIKTAIYKHAAPLEQRQVKQEVG